MALFPEMSTSYKGRTHTSLVVSEGMAPAEKYLPSATEGVKFQYDFGPEGNQGVVIPKCKVVAVAGMEWDYETEHYVPAIKIADGTDADEQLLGVNHHNVYERRRDRFSGNQPTVITREYIEVPLFSSKDLAKDINFGAAWLNASALNITNNVGAANAMFGKYVAADEFGNFTLADSTTYTKVIGQVLGVETDVPPAGYLQYFMEMDDARWAEFVKQMSYAPSPGRTKDADWNDIGTYPLGSSYLKNKEDLIKNFKAGIPFLTDGYFKARTAATYDSADTAMDGLVVRTSGHTTVVTGGVLETTGIDMTGSALFVKVPDKFAMDDIANIRVKLVDATALTAANALVVGQNNVTAESKAAAIAAATGLVNPNEVHVDVTNNMVVVYLDKLAATTLDGRKIVVEATVLQNQIPGIPTGWDFKGAYGAVRILLQK